MLKGRFICCTILSTLLLGPLVAAGAAPAAKPAPAGPALRAYHLGPGDEVTITVVPQKGYNSKGVVLSDGTLRLAGIGKFAVAGMTLDELEAAVRKALSRDLKDPEVTASLEKGHTQHAVIRGAVEKAGDFEVEDGLTLEGLIVLAGGLTQLADTQKIQLQRRGSETIETINLEERYRQGIRGKVAIDPGDEVFIPDVKDTVIVLGAIQKGGRFSIKPGQTTVADLLTSGRPELAGATNPSLVDLRGVELIRAGEKPRKIPVKELLKNPSSKENVVLANGDIIYLPGKKEKGGGILDTLGKITPLGFLFGSF